MASKFIIDDALISDMLNFSAKPAPTYRQAEDASMRGLESLLIPDVPGQPEGEAVYPQTAVSEQSFLDKLPFFTDTSKIDLSKAPGDRGRFDITEQNIKELGNAFKGIMDMHSDGLKQIDEDFADDPIAKNALKALGYLSTGTNLAITAGFSPFTVGTAYIGDLIANVTGDETTGRQLFRDLNTFLIGKGGEAPVVIKIPSKKGVVNATVNKDGSINVGEKTYGGDLNLNRAQFMELVRRETFGSAGRETGNLNLMPLREDGLPSPTVQKTIIPKVETKNIPDNTPISVKPVPKKVAIDKGLSDNEGVYMANVDGKNVDLKDKTFNTANISVTPEGVPKFDVQNVINRDIEKVPGSKLTKVNLFKKSAGWKWLDKPKGGNDSFLVSVEQGGKHYYTLGTNMTADTQLKYYPNEKSEPRLRPTAYDDLILGNQVGEIDVRGKKHPVYDSIEVSSPKQSVGADVTPKIKMNNVTEKSQNDFFETSYEYDTYDGRIEDMEYRYHGGVGDLGDNQAAKTIQKIDGYDDYAMYLQEQAENFLGSEFKGFRITNTKEVMQLLNNQNKNKIKSFTLNPKQAVKFGYFANEAFMDPITTQPRGDLLIIESPIKSTSLVMRGRPEEAEVVSNTARTSIKQSRIYDPYTGEVVYEPTEGPLVGTQPHQFETLIRTKSDIAPFISDLKSKYTKKDITPTVEPKYHPLDRVFKQQIREVLSTDLLSPQYLAKLEKDADISCGQCYAAAEAVYHKWGKFNGFTPKYLTSKDFPEGLPKGDTHWFLQNKETKEIIDPTAEQFGSTPIPYEKATGAGFLTKQPSKNKGGEILNRLGTEKVIQTPSGVILDFANQKGVEKEGADLSDYVNELNYDIEYNAPERKILGDLKNTTGKDPRFLVGFTTKDGNQGFVTGYGTTKNIGFVDYIANLGPKDRVRGEEISNLKPSELKEIKNEIQKHYGFRQFAGERITGIRKQNVSNKDNPFDKGEDLFAITPKPKSAVDIMINPFTADIAKSGKVKLRDIFDYFDDVPKRDLNDPAQFKQMINEAYDEVIYQLQQDVTGQGWYREDVKKAMKIMEKINPQLKAEPILKDFLLFLTGISSALTPVGSDFKIAIQMLNAFTDTSKGQNRRVIPLRNPNENYSAEDDAVKDGLAKIGEPKKWNRNAQNLEKQITFVQNFIDDQGLENFMKFLFTETTRRELAPLRKKYANMGPLSGKLDEKIFGFENFGPKVGPFLANISGVTNLNVVDIWNTRSMNRLTGNMFIKDKNGKIVSFADAPRTETERKLFNKFMDELAKKLNFSVDDTQAIRWYFEQGLYTKLGVKSEPKSYANIAEEFLKAAEETANESDGGVRKSNENKNRTTVTKKAQGGSISIPQRRSLVNDGLVDINTVIGKINYGN